MVLFPLNVSVFNAHAQNSNASGGPGGVATATVREGNQTIVINIGGATANAPGGQGGIAASNRSPPLVPKAPTTNQLTAPIPPTMNAYQNPTYGVTIQYPSDWIKNETKSDDRIVQFVTPQTDSKGNNIATVNLGISSYGSSSLTDNMRNEINSYDPTDFPHFRIVDSNTSSTLAGQPAFKFVFEYMNTGDVATRGVEIGNIVGSKVYWIDVVIDADQYSKYFPTSEKMIDSYTLSGNPQSSTTAAASNSTTAAASNSTTAATLLTYVNPKYGVTMQYPSDWIKNQTGGDEFVSFYSPQTDSKGDDIANVRLGIADYGSSNLTDNMRNEINTYKGWSDFRLIDSNTSSTLAGQPAFKFTFEHTPSDAQSKRHRNRSRLYRK
jgi:hypothetical protein